MKKIKSLFAVLAFGGLTLSGCSFDDLMFWKKKDTKPEEQQKEEEHKEEEQKQEEDPEAKVLIDNRCEGFNVYGNNKLIVGEEEVDNDWSAKDFNGMTAISLKEAKALDEGLYSTLKTKDLKGLYKYEGVVLGTKDAGWTSDLMRGSVKETVNGSYCVKACGVELNEDEEWVNSMWCPSAEVHGESLTPATLFITANMAEEAVDGFDHNSNPVALEAGVYTFIAATYKSGYGDMNIMCGLGLIKTEAREGYQEPETYPVTSMDVAGSFEGWGTNPVALAKSGNSFDGVVEVPANAELKVRLNGAWTYSLGIGALSTGAYVENDGNIVISDAGSYAIHVELAAAAMADFNTNQSIVSFTLLPA